MRVALFASVPVWGPSGRNTGGRELYLACARFFRSLIGCGGFNNLSLPTYVFFVAASVTALADSEFVKKSDRRFRIQDSRTVNPEGTGVYNIIEF